MAKMTKEEFKAQEKQFTDALTKAMVSAMNKVDCPLDELEYFCSQSKEIKEKRYNN